MKNIKYPLLALALIFLAFCKSTKKTEATPATTPVAKPAFMPSQKQLEVANTRWAGTMPHEITQGQEIYVTKCSTCHMAYDIMEFSEKKWIREIDHMSPKANLTPEEKLLLSKHILSFREANAPVKPN